MKARSAGFQCSTPHYCSLHISRSRYWETQEDLSYVECGSFDTEARAIILISLETSSIAARYPNIDGSNLPGLVQGGNGAVAWHFTAGGLQAQAFTPRSTSCTFCRCHTDKVRSCRSSASPA